jgi:hypothetical protein
MTKDEANAIYDILVRECGAAEGREWSYPSRAHFVHEFTRERPTDEYRFMGKLGAGGKFWPRDMRVSYYRENETSEREEMVRRANEALLALWTGKLPRTGEESGDG